MSEPLVVRLTDKAHKGPHAAALGHRDGFCLACAEIYSAYNKAVLASDDADTLCQAREVLAAGGISDHAVLHRLRQVLTPSVPDTGAEP